jgi:hypothetical protein
MKFDPHPLHPGQIQPADEPFQVDPLSEAVHSRGGTRIPPQVRALPTAATTRGHPAWRWGRSVDRPTSTSTPQIFSPSDLLPGPGQDDSHTPSIRDVIERMKKP